MNWQAFRKKIPFQRDINAPKSSSSSKSKSTADAESANGTSVVNQNIAKILIIGETGSGKLAAYLCCFKIQLTYLMIDPNDYEHYTMDKIYLLTFM